MKEKQRNRINGILGTIIFHLLFVLLFFLIKLHGFKVEEENEFLIDFSETEVLPQQHTQIEKPHAQPDAGIPQLSEAQKSNIAVNVTKAVNDEISTEKYLEKVLDELGIDALVQNHDRSLPKEDYALQNKDKKPVVSEGEYSGPTRISYFLENRDRIKIPVPSFMCETSGTVVVNIEVNQQGYVVNASISSKSTTDNECLLREALIAARKSVFNSSAIARNKQNGYITFEFEAQ